MHVFPNPYEELRDLIQLARSEDSAVMMSPAG